MNGLKVLSRAAVGAVVFAASMVALSSVSQAISIVGNKYCAAGSDTQVVSDTIPTSKLATKDVSLTIGSTVFTASNCYGDFDPGSSNAATETGALNDIFGTGSGAQPLFHLDGTGQTASATGLGGITFVVSITGGSNGAPGTWTVTWTDTNGSAGQNLPLYVDFAVLLMGGNNNAAYLLQSVLLPTSPTQGTGAFDIQFVNGGGQQPTISHLTLAGRVGSPPPSTRLIPEPATLGMFGAGLVGVWLFRRRRPQ